MPRGIQKSLTDFFAPKSKMEETPTKKKRKKVEEKVEDDDFQIDLNLDSGNEDEAEEEEVVIVQPKPKRKKVERKKVVAPLENRTTAELALQFGAKLEYLEAELKKNEKMKNDLELLKLLAENFDIKLMVKTRLSNPGAPMESKLKFSVGKYTCLLCGKSYGTKLGAKYHVEGKCPKDPAVFVCKICGFESKDMATVVVHIKQAHLGQENAKRPARGPASSPNSWIVSQTLLKRAAAMRGEIIEGKKMKVTEYKIEEPANEVTPKFNGKLLEQEMGNNRIRELELPFGEAATTQPNQAFVMNAGSRVTDCAWLRLGSNDALAVSTTSGYYSTSTSRISSSSSSFQLWRFEQSLDAAKVGQPKLACSVNVPYVINAMTQFNTDQRAFVAAACSDGFVRLIELGGNDKIEIDLGNILLLRIGGLSTSAMCIDSGGDVLCVGLSNGFVSIFERPNLIGKIVHPTRSWRAHTRPLTTLRLNPSNRSRLVTAGYERLSKVWSIEGDEVFSSSPFDKAPLMQCSTWMSNLVVHGSENFFSDHTGVVLYDPVYHESKFKLLEQIPVNCSAIDYAEGHGTLAYGDSLGRIVICSIQNPRRLFAMSRKGYVPITLQNTEITVSDSEYAINFQTRTKLDSLLGVKEKPKEHLKTKVTAGLESDFAGGIRCLKWNGHDGARSAWLVGASNSGLVRVWDVSSVRKAEKYTPPLSRPAFEKLCASFI